jgi:hypothetical protein
MRIEIFEKKVLSELVSDYSLVRFHPISVQDADSLSDFLLLIDTSIQFGEDAEPKIKDEMEAPEPPQ